MRSLWRVGALLVASFAAYTLALTAAGSPLFRLERFDFLWPGQMVPSQGQMFSAGAIGALVVSAAFLLLLYGERNPGWRFYLEVMCSGAAGGVLALSGPLLEDPNRSLELVIVVWQTGMACVLGVISSHRLALTLAPSPSRPLGRLSIPARAFFAVIIAGVVAYAGWSAYVSRQARKWQAELEAAIFTSISDAPSREGLRAIVPSAKEEVLILQPIAGLEPVGSSRTLEPADTTPGEPGNRHALRPERYVYSVRYRPINERQGFEFAAVDAIVTQYAAADWARYELRNIPMFNYPIGLPEDQRPKKLAKYGGYVFVDFLDTYWSSGEKLVRLYCQDAPPAIVDEFVKAYLAKYPSSIDASFAFPAGPKRPRALQ